MATVSTELYNIDKGILQKDAFIVIVRTEWNAAIVDELEEGCRKMLLQFEMSNYKVINVPGAFEIPFTIKSYWEACKDKFEKPHVFIALGCILRGDTPHFDYVCHGVTDGVVQLNLQLPVPTIFGVLTVDNNDQAQERIGGEHGHKGEEAAVSALKMMIFKQSFYQ